MAEIKKNAAIKKADIEPEVEKELVTDKEETKNGDTFKEKAAEAAATAALKVAIDTNNELAIRESERTYFIEKRKHMLERCKNDRVVERTISKLYAPIVGKTYTFAYNGIPVTVYCDGKPHKYPEFIANKIDKKLAKISESNTYKEVIDERLDQDTF